MTMELRMDQLEKRNNCLTVALTMTVVAMAAVVTMAATGDKDGRFDTVMANAVTARYIAVMNDAGQVVVSLGANDGGDGLIYTISAKGTDLGEANFDSGQRRHDHDLSPKVSKVLANRPTGSVRTPLPDLRVA